MKHHERNNERLDQTQLETLIRLYFDAATTEDEEDALRRALAAGDCELTPTVREAMALMSLDATRRRHAAEQRGAELRPRRRRAVYAAAAVLVGAAVVAAAWAYRPTRAATIGSQTEICRTYIAGRCIEDRDVVMNVMAGDLAVMAEASREFADGMDSQINEISDIINDIPQQ